MTAIKKPIKEAPIENHIEYIIRAELNKIIPEQIYDERTNEVVSNIRRKVREYIHEWDNVKVKKIDPMQIQKGLKNAALHLQNEVKQSIAGRKSEPTSVDTGRFLNSIDISVGKNDAVIFTNVHYAKYLEYGTSRIKARRHFNNSKDRNKDKIKNIMKNSIINVLNNSI